MKKTIKIKGTLSSSLFFPTLFCDATSLSLAATAALLLFTTAACGPGGPSRYEVSGKATLGGKPIPAGKILFEPDSAAENTGPVGMAEIKNGQYKTLPEYGAGGGPYVLRIWGYDGDPPPGWEGNPMGRPLIDNYTIKADLSREAATLDIDVPAAR